MANPHKPKRTIKTTSTVFDIIDYLQSNDGMTPSELSHEMDMAQSTIHDHLVTLEMNGYVVRDGSSFQLSLKFLDHGIYAKQAHGYAAIINQSLEQIAEETQEVVWYIVEEHDKAVYVEKAEGSHAVLPGDRVGKRRHLHCPAAGKSILAQWPDDEIEAYAERTGLPAETDHSITELGELMEEIDQIRERGYALNDEEVADSVRAVAAPIHDEDEVIGGVAIGAPINRLKGDQFTESLPEKLLGYSNEIELRIKYQQ